MECVPIPPSSCRRTALPVVPLADCTWTVPSTCVMLLKVSRKVTVPTVSGVAPASTAAVIVNTDPLAAVEGVTVSVVVVAVCAPATAKDITVNKTAHRDVRGFLRRAPRSRVFRLLNLPNIPSTSPEICGNPIASERNVEQKRGCENTHLAAAMKNHRDPHVVLAGEAGWQKRSGDESLRETFTDTGIFRPFDSCSEPILASLQKPSSGSNRQVCFRTSKNVSRDVTQPLVLSSEGNFR